MLAVIVGVHIAREFLSEEADTLTVVALAFIPDRYVSHPLPWPGGTLAAWASPITHMAVHGDLTHLALNAASLAAFGGLVARRIGSLRFVLFSLFCGVIGAATFAAVNPTAQSPLIGASGAIAGMMAVSLRILFSALDAVPGHLAGTLIRNAPDQIPLAPLSMALTDRRLLTATAVWLLINLLAAFGLGSPTQVGTVAWEAHLGGYFAGLLAFRAFDVPQTPLTVVTQPSQKDPQTLD
jgi:membrane associated rhomboid family serine protease